MQKLLGGFVVMSALVGALAVRPAAQAPGSIKADLAKDWSGMKTRIANTGAAMPEYKFTFKPTPAQRNFGEQMLHIAGANVMIVKFVGAKAAPPAINDKATAKADILKALNDSFDYGIAALQEQTDETLAQTVQASFLGTTTRARVFWSLLGHAWDEYGVVTTYLRLNGIVPPASAGM